MASIYPQAQYREYLHMHGDRPSAVNWTTNDDAFRTSIRTGTNTDDLEPFIQAAIDDVYDKGGGELFFPAGTYLTTDFDLKAGVTIVGEGEHTIFKRHSNLPAQRGLINFIGVGAGIRSCCVDGDVTTPTVITGNEGTFDPDGDTLTANSAIWIHPGANNFLVSGVKFTHVGGYSLFMDARTGNLDGGQVLFNIVENCRPHYYKYDAGDTAYGGWTGGFFVKGLCTAGNPYAASNIIFLGNRANRLSGNFIWSHSDDFVVKHRNISVTGNTGQYIGRDFTMIGNVDNATVTGNTVSHIGYYHATDNDTPVVCRSVSSGIYSVAFDNAGYVTGTITGNTCRNVYGGGIDLDGFRDGSVTGNYIFCDPSYSKGIQTGDSNANGGACNVIIENNYLEGCLYGAIILANALDCTVRGNRIDHSNHSGQPIQLFAGTVVPTRNFITQNRITYTLGGAYCIVESGSGWGSSHINYVSGNVLDGGHAGEFFPNASSSSISGIPLFADSTNSSLISRSGTGSSSAVKVYITATSTRKQHLQLQADNSLLNVSADGAAQTGIFATANRTTLGFNDALFTGKVLGDAFFASYDYAGAATSYIAAHANALTNDWALLRFNKASVKWETSLTTSAGARVWTDLVPTPITGLTAGRVTFAASATTLDDDALLTWDDTNKILQCPRLWVVGNQAAQITTVIRGAAAQTNNITEWHNSSGHALAVIGPDGKFTTRDIDSSVGATASFYYKGSYSAAVIDKPLLLLSGTATALTVKQDPSTYAGIVSGAIQANSTATNAIEVIGAQGGVVADRLLSRVAYYFTKFATATMTAPTAGYGGLQYKAGKIFWYYDDSGTPQWREVDFGSVGAGVTSITGTTNQVVASASTGAVTLSLPQDIHTGAGPTFATLAISSAATNAVDVVGSVTAKGFIADDATPSYNAIQTSAGSGFYSTAGITLDTAAYLKTLASSPADPSTGYGAISHKSAATYRYWNGTAWADIDFSTAAGVTSITGTANQVIASASTGAVTLSLPQSIHTGAGPTFATLVLSSAATNALLLASGSVTAVGLIATGAAYNTIQATAGGVYVGLGVTTDQALYPKTLASNPNDPAAGYGGFSHKSGVTYRYWNGTAWADVNLSSVGGGVTALNTLTGSVTLAGTSNQITLTPVGNTITFSTPQSIHTAATPTFSTLALSSAATNALLLSSGSVTAVGLIATGAAYNTIQTTTGGLYVGLGVTLDQALYPKTLASTPNNPSAGYGGLSHKATSTYRFWNGSAWFDVDLATAGGVTSLNSLTGALSIVGTSNQITVTPSGSNVTLSTPQNIHTAAGPTFATLTITSAATNAIGVTGSIAAAGYAASSTNTDAIQATSGGVTARFLIGTRSFTLTGDSVANAGVSSAGQGRLYFDSTSNKFQISQHAGAYQDLLTTVAGTTNQVLVNGGTAALSGAVTLTLPQSIHTAATPTFSTLALSSAATNALLLSSGSVTAVGLIATGAAYNTIQATAGGLYVGLGVTLDQALYPKTLASSPNNPSAGYGGFSHKSGVTYRYWNGSAWADIDMSAAGGGVTSVNTLTGAITLAGTSNQITLTPSGNTITFSTPQNIHTAATPTFSTLALSSAATNALLLSSGSVTAVGIIATGSAYNSIQSTGGMSGLSHTATRNDGDDGFVLSRTSATARDYGLRVNSSGSFVVYDRTGSAERITVSSTGSVGVKGNLDVGYAGGDHRVFARSSDNSIVMQLFSYTGIGGFVGTLSNSSMYFRTNDADRGYIEAGGTFRMYYGVTFDASLSVGTTLGVTGAATFSSTVVATGAIASNSTAYNAIQAVQANTSGIRTYKFTAEMALYLAKYASSASITGGSTTHGALAYQAGHIYYYWNATAQTWHEVDFSAAGGGVTSLTASTGISVSASTGAVTITNTGVISLTGTTNEVTVSASTGAVTISLPDTLLVQRYNASGDGSNYTFTNSNSTFIVDTSGNLSMSADINVLGVYKMDGTTIINSSGAFIGAGVDVGTQGIAGGGFNPDVGGTQWTGQSYDISISAGQFVISGVGTYSNLRFKGGCLVSAF